jgi:RNase H-like domain found in reverse transcriptase
MPRFCSRKKGICSRKEQIRSVLDFLVPSVSKQLKSFSGLTKYFRDFGRNRLAIVKLFNSIISNYTKTKKVERPKETLAAYESIKAAVAQCTTMHFLNDTYPIYLHTDASDYGIGGYLLQVVDGTKHPIAFVSNSWSPSQILWSVIQ